MISISFLIVKLTKLTLFLNNNIFLFFKPLDFDLRGIIASNMLVFIYISQKNKSIFTLSKKKNIIKFLIHNNTMKNFVHFLTENNKKSIILFIILNILLVFVETFSIALIPLIIDFSISNNPILPQYFTFLESLLNDIDKKNILLYGSLFLIILFILKNIYVIFLVAFQAIYLEILANKLKENFSNCILMLLLRL